MSSAAIVFPFDNFGNAGTGAGALLLGDVLREALDDSDAETRAVRPHKYSRQLRIEEYPFATLPQLAAWRETGQAAIGEALADGEFTLWLAGNHLGVLPVYDAFAALGRGHVVIQLDAHLDCYDLADTTPELSHGNFLRHVAPKPSVVNVGHRDLFLTPRDIKPYYTAVYAADQAASDFPAVLAAVRKHTARAKRIWLDLDVDAIDPAYAPAVHQPQPFGLTPPQLLAIVETLGIDRLTGVSVSEFDPGRDRGDATLQLLAWLLEWLLIRRYGG